MPTIEKRTSRGRTVYHVKVRIKGFPTQTATFPRLTDARKWAQTTEATIYTGTLPTQRHGSATHAL
jgi:hypothetical protein